MSLRHKTISGIGVKPEFPPGKGFTLTVTESIQIQLFKEVYCIKYLVVSGGDTWVDNVFVDVIFIFGVQIKLVPVPVAVIWAVSPLQIVISFPASIFPTSKPKYVMVVILDEPKTSEDYIYNYKNKSGSYKVTPFNTAGWTSVEVAGKIIQKIGPILATKYIEN